MAKPIAIAKGIAFAFPDVCRTPSPGGEIPIPYPNIAQLSDATPTSKTTPPSLLVGPGGDAALLHNSVIQLSSGSEAGTGGGVKSGTFAPNARCDLTEASQSVLFGSDGRGLVRFLDRTDQNNGNASGVVLSAFPTVLVGD